MQNRGGIYAPIEPLAASGEDGDHSEHTRLTQSEVSDHEEHEQNITAQVVVHEDEHHEDNHVVQSSPKTEVSTPPQTPPKPPVSARKKRSPRVDKVVQEVIKSKMIRLFVGTWNMEGKPPQAGSLSPFITAYTHHIYAIGTQECETSIQRALLSPPKLLWEEKLLHLLGPDYILLQSTTLGATHLGIFIHSALMPLISRVRTQVVPTGIGNVVGNKGGCIISFYFGDTSFLFVGAHFTAHLKNVEQRNNDYQRICSAILTANGEQEVGTICDHYDRVFFFGDLNYRINGNRRIVEDLVKQSLIEVLVANDQLIHEKKRGVIFKDFLEGPLTFAPTYKFDENSDVYDSSIKARVPSWTDRVLFKTGEHIILQEYNSCPTIRHSDHRPVFASFHVGIEPPSTNIGRSTAVPSSKMCTIL